MRPSGVQRPFLLHETEQWSLLCTFSLTMLTMMALLQQGLI